MLPQNWHRVSKHRATQLKYVGTTKQIFDSISRVFESTILNDRTMCCASENINPPPEKYQGVTCTPNNEEFKVFL